MQKNISILFFLFCFVIGKTEACNSREHHAVLSHYNHAQKVFEGKAIKVGNENKKGFSFEDTERGQRSVLVKFEVLSPYKNCQIKEEITVGILLSSLTEFEVGGQYLIYANKLPVYDFLVCENGFSKTDADDLAKHAFLYEIPYQHSGPIVEYSSFGRKWVEGQLENGLPVGEWKYYALTGELQIKGNYEKGEEVGSWEYYFHTLDANYRILQEIESGAYFKNTGSYQVITIDTNQTGIFKHQLSYLVESDTISERYYYNKTTLAKKVTFQDGLRNGLELEYNEDGLCLSSYSFSKERLEGPFFKLQSLPAELNTILRVEGVYRNDKKLEEKHLYFDNQELVRTKEIIKGGKLL